MVNFYGMYDKICKENYVKRGASLSNSKANTYEQIK